MARRGMARLGKAGVPGGCSSAVKSPEDCISSGRESVAQVQILSAPPWLGQAVCGAARHGAARCGQTWYGVVWPGAAEVGQAGGA